MANVHYPHLFTPITVRGKRIKNRIAARPTAGPTCSAAAKTVIPILQKQLCSILVRWHAAAQAL